MDQILVKYTIDMFNVFVPMSLEFIKKKMVNYVNVCDS